MTSDEWQESNAGDVLQHEVSKQTYVVVDTGLLSEGIIILSRTVSAQNPGEWTRKRKTVDAEPI